MVIRKQHYLASESLRRIVGPNPKQQAPSISSDELARDIERFLSNGGQIQKIPTHHTENPAGSDDESWLDIYRSNYVKRQRKKRKRAD